MRLRRLPGLAAHCECAQTSHDHNDGSYTMRRSMCYRESVQLVVHIADMTSKH